MALFIKYSQKNFITNIFAKIFLTLSFLLVLGFSSIVNADLTTIEKRTLVQNEAQTNTPNADASKTANSIDNWSSSSFTIKLSDYDPINRGAQWTETKLESSGTGWKGIVLRFLEKVSNLMLMIIPILAAVALIIAGYFYIFSFSDEENVTKAKTIIKYNLLAMVVAFGSWAIISTIAGFFK